MTKEVNPAREGDYFDHSRDWKPVPDPTSLTTAQLGTAVASLKEVVFTRLDAMDQAMVLANQNATRVPTEIDRAIDHLKELHGVRFGEVGNELKTKFSTIEARLDAMDKASDLLQDYRNQLPGVIDQHINSLRELQEAKLSSITEQRSSLIGMFETRIAAMDRAVVLLQNIADRFPAMIDEKIAGLQQIHDEKFSSIQIQFRERDVRTEQTAKDSKVAVDAALSAAKEAVGEQNKSSALAISKSEASTAKQIDALSALIQTGAKAIDDKFTDVKERLVRLEGRDEGKVAVVATNQSNYGLLLAAAAVLISIAVGIIMALHK